MISLKHFSDY